MKNVKIKDSTHKRLKLYAVKNGKDMSIVADKAILYFIKPIRFNGITPIINNTKSK